MKNKYKNFWLLILVTCTSSEQVASFGYSFWLLARVVSKLRVLATRFGDLQVVSSSREFTQKGFATHSQLASREMPRINFLRAFSWETCFKPLPSSLKPLFQYFYIKTQSIWMVFHSINISKVILNSFHWFGSLDYVFVSFVLLVEIFIIGVGKT